MRRFTKVSLSIYFLILFAVIIFSMVRVIKKSKQKTNVISYHLKKEDNKPEIKLVKNYYYEKESSDLVCSSVVDRNTGIITGRVTHKDTGKAVDGIRVECIRLSPDRKGKEEKTIFADSNNSGLYVIENLAEGIYEVNVVDEKYSALPCVNVGVNSNIVSQNVNFNLVSSSNLSGKVYDVENETAISGVVLELRSDGDKMKSSSKVYLPVTTDLKGEFHFNNIYPTKYNIDVKSDKYYYTESEEGFSVDVEEGELSNAVEIGLKKGLGKIKGIIRGERGGLLGGVDMELREISESGETVSKCVSEEDGKFTLDNLFLRKRSYELVFTHNEYREASKKIAPKDENDEVIVNVVMERGGSIKGIVKNEDGDALEGIKLYLFYIDRERVLIPNDTEDKKAETDQFGLYKIYGLNPGEYKVIAEKEKYGLAGSGMVTIENEETVNLDITLEKSWSVSGQVRTTKFEPIEGVEIFLEGEENVHNFLTDERGIFHFDNLLEGNYILRARRRIVFYDGEVMQEIVRSVNAGGSNTDVEFCGVGSIKGVVRSAVNSEVLHSYSVELEPVLKENGESRIKKKIKDSETGEFNIKYIGAGVYYIRVNAQGYNTVLFGPVSIAENAKVSDIEIYVMPIMRLTP